MGLYRRRETACRAADQPLTSLGQAGWHVFCTLTLKRVLLATDTEHDDILDLESHSAV
jgi:hypothetical protein